jgi:hypothetical protein
MNKQRYYKLIADLEAVEAQFNHGYFLSDQCVDAENVPEGVERDSEDWYFWVYASACSAAGSRAEEKGLNINELLGYSIY